MEGKYKVITLCGSTRFKDEFIEDIKARYGNTPGAALPDTGGVGTTLFYLLGMMLTGLAGAGLVMRKRRREA